MERDLHIAALGHLAQMSQQAKAGHIGTGVDVVLHHGVPGRLIQRGHHTGGQLHAGLGGHIRLGGRGQHTDANGLGEQQHISGLGAGVGQNLVGMHKAGDAQAVFGLIIQNAVAAGDEGTSLIDLVIAAPQQLMHRVLGHGLGDGHDVQAQLGLSTHGVHIGERIGGRDLAEGIGIVGNGREEIHRLHQGQIVADLIDGGIVTLVKAHQQIGVVMDLDALQQLGQHTGSYLGAAAGTFGQLGQFDVVFLHLFSSCLNIPDSMLSQPAVPPCTGFNRKAISAAFSCGILRNSHPSTRFHTIQAHFFI